MNLRLQMDPRENTVITIQWYHDSGVIVETVMDLYPNTYNKQTELRIAVNRVECAIVTGDDTFVNTKVVQAEE